MQISLRGDRQFYESVIACAETALRGEYAEIAAAPHGAAQGGGGRITFLPAEDGDEGAMAVLLDDIEEAVLAGPTAWENFPNYG